MPVPVFHDIYKLFHYATRQGPLEQIEDDEPEGVAISDPTAKWDIRNTNWGGGQTPMRIQIADSHDFIDMSTVTNRKSRYKEYDRLESTPEIHSALNTFADEACVSGDTLVATPFGMTKIKELAEKKDPNERFLVYCWDFKKGDYGLGWAYHPRLVKKAKTVRVMFDNGKYELVTDDHKFLTMDNEWVEAGKLKRGMKVKPFYRLPSHRNHNNLKTRQFPRIFTFQDGWIHERQFIDEWKTGENIEQYDRVNMINRHIARGLNIRQLEEATGYWWKTLENSLAKEGFTYKEVCYISGKYKTERTVVGVVSDKEMDVYDLSVEEHKNFATENTIVHNCQTDDDGYVIKCKCSNPEVKEEIDFLIHRLLKLDERVWGIQRNLCKYGDQFFEIVIDPNNPKRGILKLQVLPADSIYRIETVKGRIVEFQQSQEGPDYQSLARVDITKASQAQLMQATALRFHPDQIVHARIGDDRKMFFPYGVSMIEAARGPAHQLRLMEDAMLVYRLTRAPERRVFYIDLGQVTGSRAEAQMDRLKDQFRKKKVFSKRGSGLGASAVEERYNPMPPDEDIFVPMRPNSQTRIETLPGACLALDTKIPLLDGSKDRLDQIIERYKAGEQLWAYSCHPQTGEIVPGLVTWAGITKRNTSVVKVHLDNGESITCTPEHKFPIVGKGFVKACDLKEGFSVFPFNMRKKSMRPNATGYHQIYDPKLRKWRFAHRMVAEFTKNTKYGRELIFNEAYRESIRDTVHHVNGKKLDNRPQNLAWMNWNDHIELHHTLPKDFADKISKGLKRYHQNLSQRAIEVRDKRLRQLSEKGSKKIRLLLNDDSSFAQKFKERQREGWEKAKGEKPELHRKRGEKIADRNKEYWSNPENKKKVFAKQTIQYPSSIFSAFMELLSADMLLDEIISQINGNQKLMLDFANANQHIQREGIREGGLNRDNVKKMLKLHGYTGIRDARKSICGSSIKTAAGIKSIGGGKGKLYGKSTIVFPSSLFGVFMKGLRDSDRVEDILAKINNNDQLMKEFADANKHVQRKGVKIADGVKRTHVNRMVKSYGYDGLDHARKESHLYNHKIVSVEYLNEKIDVGTLTIDESEELHNFHTFAINGCFVKNSNLGEIDDAIYFRQRLFTALQFPKNYLTNEDPQATKLTLSQQDVRFARLIERLQSPLARAIQEVVFRHLRLRGYPKEMYRDLEIKMTPPSDWRQINRNEVTEVLFNRAATMKGSQLMSDYDILIKILGFDEDEAKDIAARNKAQKMDDLKMQIVGQNPEALGLVPMQADQGQQIGAAQGGPNPMLEPGQQGAEGQPPGIEQQQPGAEGQSPEGASPEAEGSPESTPGSPEGSPQESPSNNPSGIAAGKLPEPSEDDIKKYDLSITDTKFMDEEEVDIGELDGDTDE